MQIKAEGEIRVAGGVGAKAKGWRLEDQGTFLHPGLEPVLCL